MVSSILASIAKSRGMSIVDESAYTFNINGVYFLKPLRDLLQKWVLYYMHIKQIGNHLDFSKQVHLRYTVVTNVANL